MPRLKDDTSLRLFRIFDNAGFVTYPTSSSEPVVLLEEIASVIRRRGQQEVKAGRLNCLLYVIQPGNPIFGWEAVSIANALGIDMNLIFHDAVPKFSTKPKSLMDELR